MKEPSRVVQAIHPERASAPARLEPEPGVPAAVDLHIEELVLHGFAPQDGYRIADAVERELVRLLESQSFPGTFTESMAFERIDVGSVQVRRGAQAEAIGSQTAQALHRGVGKLPRVR